MFSIQTCLSYLTEVEVECIVASMDSAEELYRSIGQKIRNARARSVPRLSQEKLARRLKISRASVVNIEAGRQHAPVHLLWRIALALDTDLVSLIPNRAELIANDTVVELNDNMRKQIELESTGNPKLRKSLTKVVGRLLTSIENTPKSRKP